MPEKSSSPSGEKKWFYHENDQALGPYSIQDLKELEEFGRIPATSWIAEAGAAQWKPLSRILCSESQVHTPPPPTALPPQQKPSQIREGVFGCLLLTLIFIVPTVLFFKCYGGNEHPSDDVAQASADYQLACIDAGRAVPKSSPELEEYRVLLKALSKRFNITEKRVAAMTLASSEHLHRSTGIHIATLELMKLAERGTSGDKAEIMGRNEDGYASTLATVAVLTEHNARNRSR